jgi:hypothetical protein
MEKMELSRTIPLTELPAENKVLNRQTGGSVPVDVDAFIAHQAADSEFCLSLWLRFINSHSERGLQHNTISLVQNFNNSSRLLRVFNNRAFSPLCCTSLLLRPHFPMANSQHDPVVAQLERQKLTASPSHLAVFYFYSTFLPSSSSRA